MCLIIIHFLSIVYDFDTCQVSSEHFTPVKTGIDCMN